MSCLLLVVGCARTPVIVSYADSVAGRVILRDVDVFTGQESGLDRGRDVWLADGRIERVVPSGEAEPPASARVVDGTGLTVLPGFIDVHTHVGGSVRPPWALGLPNRAATIQKYLYAGITTIFDLGGGLRESARLRDELDAGRTVGPDLRFSGPHIAIADGHPAAMVSLFVPWPFDRLIRKQASFEVKTQADIDDALAELRKYGAQFAKVTLDEIPLGGPKLSPALLRYAVERAHASGLTVVAHIGTNEEAMEAIEAGVDALMHNVYRDTLDPRVARAIAQKRVPVAPTIGVFHAIDLLAHNEAEPWTPLEIELLDARERSAIENRPKGYRIPAAFEPWLEATKAHRLDRFANARLLRESGVPLLVGSDSATLGWEAGAALHRELDYLVRAGYSPTEVLNAVTRNNAELFGLSDRGRVAPGLRADLVVVDGDPTTDFESVHRIVAVYRSGREVTRHTGWNVAQQ